MLAVMFDIGLGEMILVGIIALIAIGPKQLPEVARSVGRLLNELKKTVGEVTSTVASVRDETDKAIRKVTHDLTDITTDINQGVTQGLDLTIHKQPEAKPIVPLQPHAGDPPWVVNPDLPNPHAVADGPPTEPTILPATGAAPFAMAPAKAAKPSGGEA